ncbi:hypothetical protein STEG23_000716, partial [Scotinomys teguina]
NHNCSEFMSVMAMSFPEDNISPYSDHSSLHFHNALRALVGLTVILEKIVQGLHFRQTLQSSDFDFQSKSLHVASIPGTVAMV